MLTYDTKLSQELRALIMEQVVHDTQVVIQGKCSPETYKFLCGQMNGLGMAAKMIDQAIAKLEGREPDPALKPIDMTE
jgi:hypothetical protein